ncbi:MAG: DUF1871 family protein [Bacillota bacterium]
MKKALITKIINEWDPVDLLSHAPSDEYEVEIKYVANLLKETSNASELAKGILEIFCRRFGEDVFTKDYEECLKIANKLLER